MGIVVAFFSMFCIIPFQFFMHKIINASLKSETIGITIARQSVVYGIISCFFLTLCFLISLIFVIKYGIVVASKLRNAAYKV